jgi:hypothetical protein
MRIRAITPVILSMAVSASLAGSAQAFLVAGWDFSQYLGDAVLSVDLVATPATTLDANYSDFDPTFGAGAESAAFGTMYINGSFGSTSVSPTFDNTEPILPTAGSLASNLDVPYVYFDAFTILQAEGQVNFAPLSMTAQDAVSLVFKADLSSVPETGGNWSLSFAGKTFSGSSTVGIDFSANGSSYASAGSVLLDSTDARYVVNLDSAASETVFVRFNFNPVGGAQPIIDNVAISSPEPGAFAQSLVALLALLVPVRLRTFWSRSS